MGTMECESLLRELGFRRYMEAHRLVYKYCSFAQSDICGLCQAAIPGSGPMIRVMRFFRDA